MPIGERMTWSDAVDHMKAGGAVRRPGWGPVSRLRVRAEAVDGAEEPRWIYELHEGGRVTPWTHLAASRAIDDWEVASP